MFLLLITTLCTTAIFAVGDNAILRVGLFYGNNALPTANLQNAVGSGYQVGYYDSDHDFVPLGDLSQEKITVCKDTNLYFTNGTFSTSNGSQLIGAYHLQASGTYNTYSKAAAAAKSYPYGFPAYVNGQYVVRFEFYSSRGNAQADQGNYSGATVVGGSTTCYTVVDTTDGTILFEYDNGSGNYFAIQPKSDKDESQTWFKGYKYYGGFEYARRLGGDITVINYVPEDLYVAGVLPYEFVASGHVESLKAGAVAIRTYAHAAYKHNEYGFDVCNSTCCQVYRGVYSQTNADKVKEASLSTSGVCAYYNGKLIEATYFASSGGATEDAKNTWGSDVPYLVGKQDPYEMSIAYPGKTWEYFITPAEVTKLLQNRGNNNSTIVSIEVTERTAMGNVNEVVFTDSQGREYDYSKDNVRIFQTLPGVTYSSRNFEIVPAQDYGKTGKTVNTIFDGTTTTTADSVTVLTANGTDTVSLPATVLTDKGTQAPGGSGSSTSSEGWYLMGGGFGHNVGMSQWGAYAMGDQGYTYDEILKFYYTGITVE